MYKVSAIVEKEAGWYVAHCMELQVTSQGKSIEESLANLKEAVELYLKHASPEEITHLKKAHIENPIIATFAVGR